jgi:flagellar biosynthesis/type III secretory pathway protein FliH
MARIIRAGSEEWLKLNAPSSDTEALPEEPSPEDIIQQALAESRAIKEHAMHEAEIAKDAVTQKAYADGFAKGYQESLTSLAEVIMALSSTQSALRAMKDTQLTQAKDDLVLLAMGVAERVLRRKIPEERELVVRVIGECLAAIKDRDTVEIQVNPSDLAVVRDAEAQLQETHALNGTLVINPSAEIEPGAARVLSKMGGAEGDIAALFTRITKVILDGKTIPPPSEDDDASVVDDKIRADVAAEDTSSQEDADA